MTRSDEGSRDGGRISKEGLHLIGEVSRLGGISQRTLRHYDELGLIEPDLVAKNGYRYYSRDTMLKIPVINYLKKIGLSLEEIAQVFDSGDFMAIKRSFHKRIEELDAESARILESRTFIDDWDGLIDEANYVLRTHPTEVSLKFLPGETFLAMPYDFWGNYADATINLDFTLFVEENDNAITGPVIIRHESAEDFRGDYSKANPCPVQVLQRALRPIAPENRFERKSGMFLTAYYMGDFDGMGVAYERIFDYAEKNGHKLEGSSFERFVTDYWTTYDPSLFVTEVLLPIEQ